MIAFLEGKVEEKQPARVVMNVGGVGYEVLIPLSSYDCLPAEGENARILIYHHITDISQALFGFCSEEERKMFTLLLGVSGIGPKTAVSALSGLSVRELKSALAGSDVKRISSISGIGKKTAERVIVELRDKFSDDGDFGAIAGDVSINSDSRLRDAAMALGSLGYKQDEARKMVNKIGANNELSVEEIIRKSLTGR